MATGCPKGIPAENSFVATASDLGLTSKDIHEARLTRDADEADPGVYAAPWMPLLKRGQILDALHELGIVSILNHMLASLQFNLPISGTCQYESRQ